MVCPKFPRWPAGEATSTREPPSPCSRIRTAAARAQVKVPLLILHGEEDDVIPVEMGRKLARLANEPKRLVIFPDGEHSNLYVDGNNALASVRKWIAGLKS